jgi:hypothetical protein
MPRRRTSPRRCPTTELFTGSWARTMVILTIRWLLSRPRWPRGWSSTMSSLSSHQPSPPLNPTGAPGFAGSTSCSPVRSPSSPSSTAKICLQNWPAECTDRCQDHQRAQGHGGGWTPCQGVGTVWHRPKFRFDRTSTLGSYFARSQEACPTWQAELQARRHAGMASRPRGMRRQATRPRWMRRRISSAASGSARSRIASSSFSWAGVL